MAGPFLFDRVKETTAVTSTGTATLLGAVTGYQSFAVVGNGNTCYYCIAHQTLSEWEVGIGTYTASGTTLARTTVLSSSNSGSAVNFSAGTKDVFITLPAKEIPVVMARVTHNTTQTVNNNSTAFLAFNTDIQNPDSLHNTVTNNTRLTNNTGITKTFTITGSIVAQVTNVANALNALVLEIWLNGTTPMESTQIIFPVIVSTNSCSLSVTSVRQLANGDYVELQLQNTGTGVTATVLNGNEYSPIFTCKADA